MDKSMIHSFVHQGVLKENVGLLIVTTFCIFLVVTLHTMFSRKSHHLPPGPWPWPIMGNLLMLGKHPHLTLTRWAERYGPFMHLRLGSTSVVVASSPTMAKEFLKTQDHVFQYRPSSLAFKILTNDQSMGLISGLALKHVRKICTNELFTFKKIQSFQPLRTKEIQETIEDIYKETKEGKVVNLTVKLISISTNNLTQMLFRKR
jgi:cytochrome P450